MTEDEAKTKWCPFVRMVFLSQTESATYAGNRFNWTDLKEGDELYGERMSGCCLGSKCATWRWIEDGKATGYFDDGTSIEGDSHIDDRDGYCGLIQQDL